MRIKEILIASSLCFAAFSAKGQFYTNGTEPYSVKWSQIHTANYKVIYPQGLDSLAMVYARTLEQAAQVEGNSSGFSPNQNYTRKMPVVLRPYSAYSNGQVTWTPRRMELQTQPDPYDPEPTPWEKQLIVHESRHSSQMQFGAGRPFRFWNILTGQLAPGALSAIYPGPAFLEGDAVVTETALSKAGRGRTADFLEYYRAAFADGDQRDFWKWRYGSQKSYTPDYYRAGYVAMAGIRTLYNAPDFTARYFQRIADKHGFAPFNLNGTVKDVSGKSFNKAFSEISDSLAAFWARDEKSRAPFIPSTALVSSPKHFTEYGSLAVAGDTLYAIRKSLTAPEELVRLDKDGKEKVITLFSSSTTGLKYSRLTDRLYWSEYKPDIRWEQKSSSDIMYLTRAGKTGRISRGKRFYHPAPAGHDLLLSVTEYPLKGGSSVTVMDIVTGIEFFHYPAPDGMQVVETVWVEKDLYASAITDEGFGIWKVSDYSCILEPQPVKIKRLWSHDGKIMFTCDRTGVNELYALNPSDGSLAQLTSTRFGADNFQFSQDGKTLYYTPLSKDGRLVAATPASELIYREADFTQLPKYPFADRLSSTEAKQPDYKSAVEVSEPESYSKLKNLLRLHSWAPLYIDYDAVSSLSMSEIGSAAAPGATVFFQDDLGSFYGSAGYKAWDYNSGWRHSGHLNLTYRGLAPVFELKVDLNDRNSIKYSLDDLGRFSGRNTGKPMLYTRLDMYLPINLSSGGWNSGIVPKISLGSTNDWTDAYDNPRYIRRNTVSVRAYMMERTTSSRIWPRIGLGAEFGYSERTRLLYLFSPSYYFHLYGYAPGLFPTHGLKLSGIYEIRRKGGQFADSFANMVPRGFLSAVNSYICGLSWRTKVSADYAIPFAAVDWSFLSPLTYIRNFELIPHADLTLMPSDRHLYNLYSIGADLKVRLGNLIWIPYTTRIGLRYDYNGGNCLESIKAAGIHVERHSLQLIMSVDM